ncbi:hypothetical protein [Mucilaginibacter auburnensis]|uniref:Uncharacterized protein n=1 Tax=Mucilaginibacter auburnensis TaxID=1457233 RepID=A0A2H9VLM1_9SPHI|nr:hypothetical protein [Mucilaginibacter auburnensis]PJJ79212.1 hypothetical protein CLV57_2338 [Mucilaginibacter auburnensis]
MKNLIVSLLLVLSFLGLKAQQPKAYDIVRYTAKYAKQTLKLDYADGYPAASKMSLMQAGTKTEVLESDGLIFTSKRTKARIVVPEIDTDAPKFITASYELNGKIIKLVFNRRKKNN